MMLKKIFKWVIRGVIALLLLCSFVLAALQMESVRKEIVAWIAREAKKEGVFLSFGSVQGTLPFKWTIANVCLDAEEFSFEASSIQVRISLIPLLYRELSINYLAIEEGKIKWKGNRKENGMLQISPEALAAALPFHLSIQTLKIPNLTIRTRDGESLFYSIEGKARIKAHFSNFLLRFKAFPLHSLQSYFEVSLDGNQMTQYLVAKIRLKALSTALLRPFLQLPFDVDVALQAKLEGSYATWSGFVFGMPEVETRPLKGQIRGTVNRLEIAGVKTLDRSWTLGSSFLLNSDRSGEISKLTANSDLLSIDVKAILNKDFYLESAAAQLELLDLSLLTKALPLGIEGSSQGTFSYTPTRTHLAFRSDDLKINREAYAPLRVEIEAERSERLWEGSLSLSADHPTLPLSGSSYFSCDPGRVVKVEDLLVTLPESRLYGNLDLLIPERNLEGDLLLQAFDLSHFERWAANKHLSGSLAAETHLKIDGQKRQSLHLQALLKNLRYGNFKAEEMAVEGNLVDLLQEPKGSIAIDASRLTLLPLSLSSLRLKTYYENHEWPFVFDASGIWEEQLEIHSAGIWALREGNASLHFKEISGLMLKKPFALEKPFTATWNKDQVEVSACDIDLGEGHLAFSLQLSEQAAKGYLKATHFPLDIFLFSHPTMSLRGTTSIDAFFDATQENLQGRLNLLLERADIAQLGQSNTLKTKGSLQANIDRKTVQVHAHALAAGDQFLDLNATLPISYSLLPFRLKIDETQPVAGELTMEGKLEEMFDFINIGSHRLTGFLAARLLLSQTYAEPSLNGLIELQDGSYENYYTGTYFTHLFGKAIAQGNELRLLSLKGGDDEKGSLTATGTMQLQPSEHFPYTVHAQLTDLRTIRFDSLSCAFTGPLELIGTTKASVAKGDLMISQANIEIPDELPLDLPILPITFVNPPEAVQTAPVIDFATFPFHYDLELHAAAENPGKIIVRGRGLRSEWEGDIRLTGTNSSFGAEGVLTLLRGEYLFWGKVFTLTHGEIALLDRPSQSANLTLSGTLSIPEATITALLTGPLSSPQLTFQSMPSMPTSSILSRILFNKDISEITPAQAIQVAQMIVSMSGGAGPAVLEKIRKTLGVDRLNIVSASDGSDQVALQIGKYLTRGVMITLSQGTDSSQIIVDVELKGGFVFQAETLPEQEGKFTLKWNRNY